MNSQLVTVTVPFHSDSIITVKKGDTVYVAMRRIVENLGMSWSTQLQKLERCVDKFGCVHMNTPTNGGGRQDMLCIPLKKLNGWLFSINPNKVHPAIRDTLIAYQEECFEVLHDYWTTGTAVKKSAPAKAPAPAKPSRRRYRVRVIVYDDLFGGCIDKQLTVDTFKAAAEGVSELLGYQPSTLIELPGALEGLKNCRRF